MPDTPDHDLLIELRTEMRGLRIDVSNISKDSAERLKDLELTKFSSKEFAETWGKMINDHETRLRVLETIANQGKGSERVIQAIIATVAVASVELILKFLLHV
jgi:hypothetical protein